MEERRRKEVCKKLGHARREELSTVFKHLLPSPLDPEALLLAVQPLLRQPIS